MGRTKLSPKRIIECEKTNIGHIIIFCEGNTEKYYFEYFAEIINKNKYNDIEIILESANGNAQAVLNQANNFMKKDENIQKFSNYSKYLAFDCDAPDNIQEVILNAKDYELLISNSFFETWLLMHFEDVTEHMKRKQIYRNLSHHLSKKYAKGQKGRTREMITNGNVEAAIENARKLDEKYREEGKNIFTNIKEMNPFTNVYKLIEQFMLEIS